MLHLSFYTENSADNKCMAMPACKQKKEFAFVIRSKTYTKEFIIVKVETIHLFPIECNLHIT